MSHWGVTIQTFLFPQILRRDISLKIPSDSRFWETFARKDVWEDNRLGIGWIGDFGIRKYEGRERYSDFQNVGESVFVNDIADRSGEGISLLSCFVKERSKFVCLKTTRVTKHGRECVRVFGFIPLTMLLVRKYFTNSSCNDFYRRDCSFPYWYITCSTNDNSLEIF